jgi:hypothetical protein
VTPANHRRVLAAPACVLVAAALAGLALRGNPELAPRSVDELAGRAESGGWRVVATGGPGVRDGFYALPPGDGRSREEMAGLSRWRSGWGAAVVVTPYDDDYHPSEPLVYAGRGWQVFGEPQAVRAFIEACGLTGQSEAGG